MDKLPFTLYEILNYLGAGFVLIAAVDIAFNAGWFSTKDPPLGFVVLTITIAYIAGHVVANFSGFVLERVAARGILGAPEDNLFAHHRSRLRFLFPGYFDPLPEQTRARVFDGAEAAGITKPGRALFYHCHAIVKHSAVVNARLSTFLNMYGFCRNVGAACLMAAAIIWFEATFGAWLGRAGQVVKFRWSAGAFFAGVVMFYRYLKFYRHYTVEVFTSYAEKAALARQEVGGPES